MKNKIYSSKDNIFVWFTCSIIMTCFIIFNIFLLISSIINKNKVGIVIGSIDICFGVLLLTNYLTMLNRFGCVVWFDEEKNEICRKGFFCGFRYRISTSKIIKVYIATFPRDHKYIIIMDNTGKSDEGFSKDSFIRLAYNNDNINFVKRFWSGPIGW